MKNSFKKVIVKLICINRKHFVGGNFMNDNRVQSIKNLFEGVGPVEGKEYTNQEITELLQEMQKTMMAGVYEKTHAEYMKEKDLLRHFTTLATEYGLNETDTYKRFEKNMNELGYTIGTFIKGLNGERIAKRALKLISFDEHVKILYNIALEDEDMQAEYDAIVITPYGLFVVEVKNWGSEMTIDENGILRREDRTINYDVPGRMSVKEGLLREYLEDLFPENYQSIMLFPNENAKVNDNYKRIPICYGGGIAYTIRERRGKENLLSKEQVNNIEKRILENHREQKAPCKVKCGEIIEDYAELMAQIEMISESQEHVEKIEKSDSSEIKRVTEENTTGSDSSEKEGVIKEIKIPQVIGGIAAGFVVAFGLGIVVTKAYEKF